jgi:hypothetical protein
MTAPSEPLYPASLDSQSQLLSQKSVFILEYMKTCFRCGIARSAKFFGTDRSQKDGLNRFCKLCINTKRANQPQMFRFVEHLDHEKVCSKCMTPKAFSEFSRHSSSSDGLSRKCKLCTSIDLKETRGKRPKHAQSDKEKKGSYDECPLCKGLKGRGSRLCRECGKSEVRARNNGSTKLCILCNTWLPLAAFGVNKGSYDRLQSWCRPCTHLHAKKVKQERVLLESISGVRICKQCGISKPHSDFHKHVNTILWTCKDCTHLNYMARTHKTCRRCKQILPMDKFHNSKLRGDGKSSLCKRCASLEVREYKGLPRGWYDNVLIKQNGRCAICSSETSGGHGLRGKTSFHVDHDHSCCPQNRYCVKCIRGLLCDCCNKLLGHSLENKAWLINALSYLHQYGVLTDLCWVGESCDDSASDSDASLSSPSS